MAVSRFSLSRRVLPALPRLFKHFDTRKPGTLAPLSTTYSRSRASLQALAKSDTPLQYNPNKLAVAAAGAVIGATAALMPILVIPILGALIVLPLIFLIRSGPQKALRFCFFLLLLSSIKFRTRDGSAALGESGLDAQVIFELALYGLVLLIVTLNWYFINPRDLKPKALELTVFGYVIVVIASTFWSLNPLITAVRGAQLFILYSFSFVSIRVLKPKQLIRDLTNTLTIAVTLFALGALAFPLANGTGASTFYHLRRFSWFRVHPIVAADQAAVALILLIHEGWSDFSAWSRRIVCIPLWIYLGLLSIVLLATRCRGALFALLIAVSLVYVIKLVQPATVFFALCLGLILLTSVVLISGIDINAFLEKLSGTNSTVTAFLLRGQSTDDFLSFTGRITLWRGIWSLILKHPLLGYGFSSSRRLLEILPWAGEAHNALLESLFGVGLIGTSLLWIPTLQACVRSLLATGSAQPIAESPLVGLVTLYVLLEGAITAGFTGFLTYDNVLLFSALFVFAHISASGQRSERRGLPNLVGPLLAVDGRLMRRSDLVAPLACGRYAASQ